MSTFIDQFKCFESWYPPVKTPEQIERELTLYRTCLELLEDSKLENDPAIITQTAKSKYIYWHALWLNDNQIVGQTSTCAPWGISGYTRHPIDLKSVWAYPAEAMPRKIDNARFVDVAEWNNHSGIIYVEDNWELWKAWWSIANNLAHQWIGITKLFLGEPDQMVQEFNALFARCSPVSYQVLHGSRAALHAWQNQRRRIREEREWQELLWQKYEAKERERKIQYRTWKLKKIRSRKLNIKSSNVLGAISVLTTKPKSKCN